MAYSRFGKRNRRLGISNSTISLVESRRLEALKTHQAVEQADSELAMDRVPSNNFISLVGALDGPKVTIRLGKDTNRREYTLPKDLLCHYSSYFKAVFDDHFNETQELTLVLEDVEIEPFELLIQWFYTGRFVLLNHNSDSSQVDDKQLNEVADKSSQISRYLEFFKLADCCVNEHEVTTFNLVQMKTILKSCRQAMTVEHIRRASTLPRYHPIRILFAQAYVTEYITALRDRDSHRFQEEVADSVAFSSDLLAAIASVIPEMHSSESEGGIYMYDPLNSHQSEL